MGCSDKFQRSRIVPSVLMFDTAPVPAVLFICGNPEDALHLRESISTASLAACGSSFKEAMSAVSDLRHQRWEATRRRKHEKRDHGQQQENFQGSQPAKAPKSQ